MPTLGYTKAQSLREEHARGATIAALARREKVKEATVRRILRGDTYRDASSTYALSVLLPGALIDRVRAAAEARNMTLAEFVEDALVAFLPTT